MYAYEGSKLLYDALLIPQTKLLEKNFIAGSISKIITGLIMYPLTTIRTRIQQNQYINGIPNAKYNDVWEIIFRTWK